jgi:hypothetical protein
MSMFNICTIQSQFMLCRNLGSDLRQLTGSSLVSLLLLSLWVGQVGAETTNDTSYKYCSSIPSLCNGYSPSTK